MDKIIVLQRRPAVNQRPPQNFLHTNGEEKKYEGINARDREIIRKLAKQGDEEAFAFYVRWDSRLSKKLVDYAIRIWEQYNGSVLQREYTLKLIRSIARSYNEFLPDRSDIQSIKNQYRDEKNKG